MHFQKLEAPAGQLFREEMDFFGLNIIIVSRNNFYATPRLHCKQKVQNRTTLMINHSDLPDELVHSQLVPLIRKSGLLDDKANYRAIALSTTRVKC